MEILQRQEADHAVTAESNEIHNRNVSVDNQGNYIIKPDALKEYEDLRHKYPGMSKEAANEITSRQNWIESKQHERKQAARSNPAVVGDFLKRMDDDANPLRESEIWKAEAQHDITPQDGTIFRGWHASSAQSKELKPDRDKFLARMQLSIDVGKAGGLPTALGQVKMQDFEVALRRREKELGGEARTLYDPISPNYFGKQENLLKYHVTMQQSRAYDKQLESGKPPESVQTEPARPRRRPMTPQSLMGIGALDWSAKAQQYRDRTTGKVYDRSGNEVK
jgi:hypothetical protein